MLDVLLLVQEKELQTKADQIIEDELQSKCCIMDYHTYVSGILFQVERGIMVDWFALAKTFKAVRMFAHFCDPSVTPIRLQNAHLC